MVMHSRKKLGRSGSRSTRSEGTSSGHEEPAGPLPSPSSTLHPNQLDLFSEISAEERDLFLARCSRQNFQPGANLFSQNEPYTKSYLIRSGMVRTYYVAPSGKEITIAYWNEGALVGGPSVFRERQLHIWSAQAVTEVVAEQIKGQDLEDLCMRIPRLAHYLIETLSYKLYWVSVLLQAFGTQTVRARVAYLLVQLGERHGEKCARGVLIAQHFSHEELARMVGATRSWVTLALKNLRSEEIIGTEGRDLVILDLDRLRKTAQGNAN
jgi:CRP/FNR family cyclic AMP-dependent transcriptional regulator